MSKMYLYMSRWALHGGVPGLSLFLFDTETGAIELVKHLDEEHSFGCSQIDYEKKILYVCNETDLCGETEYNTGRIYGFRIDPDTDVWEELFRQDTYCPYPDYISFSPDRRFMIVPHHSNATQITAIEQDENGVYQPVIRYMDSAVDLFSMKSDGTVEALVDVKKHPVNGRMIDYEGKVTIPHPHSAVRSPSGKLFSVCDKGDCHLFVYEIDAQAQKLKLLSRTMTDVPMSEPRYCAYHPTLPYLFVNHEHAAHGSMTVTACRYDEKGGISLINKVNCLPEGYTGACAGQGFCLSADGKTIYNQIAGCNIIAVLSVDQETGAVTLVQRMPVQGKKPRNCALSPDGRFLINTCISGEIEVFAVQPDGTLQATSHTAFLQGSAYITFYDP